MKCRTCGSNWNSIIMPIQCPFCGANLVNEDEKNFVKILGDIIESYGMEIFSGSKAVAIAKDLLPEETVKIKLFKIAVENNIVQYIDSRACDEGVPWDVVRKTAVNRLHERAFLDVERADEIVTDICKAMGYEMGNDKDKGNVEVTQESQNDSLHVIKKARDNNTMKEITNNPVVSKEDTLYAVVLLSVGPEYTKVFKCIREVTGNTAKDTKLILDNPPHLIKQATLQKAELIKKQLGNYGAKVSIKEIKEYPLEYGDVTITKEILFTGVYYCYHNDYTGFLRFFPDGTVVSVSCAGMPEPEKVAGWLNKDYESRGIYSIENDYIEFQITSCEGVVEYKGVIIDNENIHLTSHSYINGYNDITDYKFYSLSKSENKTSLRNKNISGLTEEQARELVIGRINSILSTTEYCREHGISQEEWDHCVRIIAEKRKNEENELIVKETVNRDEGTNKTELDDFFARFDAIAEKCESQDQNPFSAISNDIKTRGGSPLPKVEVGGFTFKKYNIIEFDDDKWILYAFCKLNNEYYTFAEQVNTTSSQQGFQQGYYDEVFHLRNYEIKKIYSDGTFQTLNATESSFKEVLPIMIQSINKSSVLQKSMAKFVNYVSEEDITHAKEYINNLL